MATKSNGKQQRRYVSALKKTGVLTEKATDGLLRWATTDHFHMAEALNRMPSSMGFIESLKYVLLRFVMLLISSLIMGVAVFVLVAYVLPYLLSALLF